MAKRTLKYLGEDVAFAGRWASVFKRRFLDATGREQVFEVVHSNRGKQFVVTLPVTQDGRVIMIRQQRVNLVNDDAVGDERYCVRTFELPAGFVGLDVVNDSQIIHAAVCELQEETGYSPVGNPVILARHVPCEVGRNDGEVTLVFMRVESDGGQNLEDSEVIEVYPVSVNEVFQFLDGKPYVDSLLYMALAIAKHRGLI